MGRVIGAVFFSFIFFFVITVKSMSQPHREDLENNNLLIKDHWTKGKVVLTDNTVYEGEINFQENFDLVRVKTSDKIKTFTPRQVKHFSYYDRSEKHERLYISIPYESSGRVKTLIFFEVLKETKDVALLSRRFNLNMDISRKIADNMTPMTILTPYGPYTIPGSFGPPVALNFKYITNRETLFLANDKGSIEPFVVISYRNIEPDKGKLLDRSLMREFFGDSYKDCKEFADRYELDLKDKDDLMVLLEYYERIRLN